MGAFYTLLQWCFSPTQPATSHTQKNCNVNTNKEWALLIRMLIPLYTVNIPRQIPFLFFVWLGWTQYCGLKFRAYPCLRIPTRNTCGVHLFTHIASIFICFQLLILPSLHRLLPILLRLFFGPVLKLQKLLTLLLLSHVYNCLFCLWFIGIFMLHQIWPSHSLNDILDYPQTRKTLEKSWYCLPKNDMHMHVHDTGT